jgi:ankyrin repeat protein
MKFGKSKKDITPHLLIATIAAMLLYVAASWWAGSGESQSPEPQTTKAPDISIHMAAEDGNIEVVKQHIAAGTDVNAKEEDGTPLHYAAWNGHKEVVELLIAAGTDVNAKEEDGTPLHYAAWNGHKEVVELLIAAGADVNAKDDDGETPLDWAIDDKQTATADLLRKHGGKTGAELKAEGK